MASVNDQLCHSFVTMTANLQRLSESERLVVVGTLKGLEQEIATKLQDNPDMTSWRKSRYEALLSQTQGTIKTAYQDINKHTQGYLSGVASVSSQSVKKSFAAVGIPLQSVVLTPEQCKAIATDSMIQGAPCAAWWGKQSQALQDAFLQQMRMGYAAGETVDQLVQRVRGTSTGKKNQYEWNGKTKVFTEFRGGIMDTGTRQAEALVRTSTQQISADARMETFRKNKDILKGVAWISTLDMRTTQMCAARDGKMWDLDGNPIPPNTLPSLGFPPCHWNCRSTLVPVTKSFEELGAAAGTDKEYLDQIGAGTRASMDGQVPASQTFDEWFGTLSEADQKAYLGPKKWQVWKDAGLTFAEMTSQQGNPLTLQQLADAYDFKIAESWLSGQPNIPAVTQNALVTTQQTQAAISAANVEASQSAQAQLDSLLNQGGTAKQVYDYLNSIGMMNTANAQSKLDALTDTMAKVEQVQKDVDKFESTLSASVKSASKDTTSQAYIDAKEKQLAFERAKAKAPISTHVMSTYEDELAALKHSNQVQMVQWNMMSGTDTLAGLQEEFVKLHPTGSSWWDMQQLMQDFNLFVKDQDALAAQKLSKYANTPLREFALDQAVGEITQGQPGSSFATLQRARKRYEELYAKNLAAMDSIDAALASGDPAYKVVYESVKASNPKSLAFEMQDMISQAMDTTNANAKALIESATSAGDASVELKAIKLTSMKYGSLDAYMATTGKSAASYALLYQQELSILQDNAQQIVKESIKQAVGTATTAGDKITVGSKTYDLTVPEELSAYKKHKSMLLSKYKQSIVTGKAPNASQQAVYDSLVGAEKEAFDAALSKAANKAAPITSNATPAPGVMQMSQMEKYGDQLGSNNGGFYRDKVTGQEFYIKFPGSEDVVRNELVSGKLYQALGVDVPELTVVQNGSETGLASKIKAGLVKGTASQLAKAAGAAENFAIDAWMANWDVVGLGYDNLLLTDAGTAFRVDVGGSLRYRAQGGLKGASFGDTVSELDSLRNKTLNPQSSSVFGKISKKNLEAGVSKILAMPDSRIRSIVLEFGPTDTAVANELADTLIARKKYLAQKFPNLVQPVPAAVAEGTTTRISQVEIKSIEQSRANGFALKADKNLVEDQSILTWNEKTVTGADVTGLKFKFTPQAQSQVAEKIGSASNAVDPALQGQYDNFIKQLHAQWNVSFNQKGKAIDAALAKKNIATLKATFEDLVSATAQQDPAMAKQVTAFFKPYVFDIEKSLSQKVFKPLGTIAVSKFQQSQAVDFAFNPVKVTNTGAAKSTLTFKKVPAKFELKELKNGYVTSTGKPLVTNDDNGIWQTCFEAKTPDGVRVRVWLGSESGGQALANTVEVMTPGKDAKAIQAAIQLVEKELGIPLSKPDALATEEMYLRMIARHRGEWGLLDEVSKPAMATADTQVRVQALRDALSKSYGTDITKLADYNPDGVYEAFNTGQRRWYMPGATTDKAWKKLTDNHLLLHQITGGRDMVGVIDSILSSGGKMTPTADKLRKGINWGGMSPSSDMNSGGADYFFTRVIKANGDSATRSDCIFWKGKQLTRMDKISYNNDMYGRTTGDTVRKNALTAPSQISGSTRSSTNETIFKGGLSLFDDLAYFSCQSDIEAQRLADVLAKHGWSKTWVDGRLITDVIRIYGKPWKKI